MIKPRSRNVAPVTPSLDDFIRQPEQPAARELEPNASRKFKTVSLPMNEYEYSQLHATCKKTGRSEKNLLRYAMMLYAKEVLAE
uniref:Plasmid segregation centromere-binding protein ParG n=1 Tax=Chlorobium chlorochromatii (strain CaD3) TaxID=340177 RepID=Q3ASN6_CHLCH